MAAQQPDMDDLLDSALADFDNLPKPKLNNKKAGARKVEANNSNGPSEEDFMKIFASAGGQGDTEGLQAELEKLAGVAGGGDMAASLADTLAQMTKETEGLSGQPTEEELNKMFSGLGMSGGQGKGQEGFDNLLPMMEGMMQSLLSKELLYPAMKELAEKYPDYLADNRSSLTMEQFDAYNKQCDLIRRICFKFEEEDTDKDTEEDKKLRFQAVMGMMQEMQALGHPPKELTGDTPTFPMPGEGSLPGLPQECTIS